MAKVYTEGTHLTDDVVVEEMVQVGGQGITYRCYSRSRGCHVLVKQLNADPGTTNGKIAHERFKREQSINIDSPHVPKVLDFFEHEGSFFITTEFIEGMNLDEKLADGGGPLGCDETRDILTQLGRGLRQAHDKGIVHRDIKGANVMAANDGRYVLVDWGLCRFMDARTIHDTDDPMGTLHYMSPEHVRNSGVDGQSDLFSTGVLGYRCLTGEYPFDGEDEAAIFSAILFGRPIPPTALNPAVDSELESIVLKLLEKEKTRRYPDAHALLKDLDGGFGASAGGSRCPCGEPVAMGALFCVACGMRRSPPVLGDKGALRIANGVREGTRIPVTASGLEIGRYSLDPDDDFVSRRHARIFLADGNFWVEDLGSLNGTYVNSHAIPKHGRHPVVFGDCIRFADTFCEFVS